MSELPPDFPEATDTITSVDAPDVSQPGSDTDRVDIAPPGGTESYDDGNTLAGDAADDNFGDLDEADEPAAGAESIAGSADIDLFADDGDADVYYPTFGSPNTGTADEAGQEVHGGGAATVVDMRPDAAPEDEVLPGDELDDEVDVSDTPQGGRSYPSELLDLTDGLMGEGDAGEESAMSILEAYDQTGAMPIMPKQPASSETAADEDQPAAQTETLF